MKLKMNLTKDGLEMFFKDYQINVLEVLWKYKKGLGTKRIWNEVGSKNISRASIIMFIENMVEIGLIEKTLTTGKGGQRGIYKIKYEKTPTKEFLKNAVINKLKTL